MIYLIDFQLITYTISYSKNCTNFYNMMSSLLLKLKKDLIGIGDLILFGLFDWCLAEGKET